MIFSGISLRIFCQLSTSLDDELFHVRRRNDSSSWFLVRQNQGSYFWLQTYTTLYSFVIKLHNRIRNQKCKIDKTFKAAASLLFLSKKLLDEYVVIDCLSWN